MIKYKLTTQEMTTHGGFRWEIGKKFITSGKGGLCGPGFLHYYHHPLLAVLLNPMHADITDPRLWEVEADGDHENDNYLKGGCTEMTIVNEIPIPEITMNQRTAFSILTSLDVYKDKNYAEWAENWLNGKDRSESAAWSAAESAAESAAWSAARSAAWSAESAAWSAESAAWSAAWSAESAAWSADELLLLKLVACAEKCLEY